MRGVSGDLSSANSAGERRVVTPVKGGGRGKWPLDGGSTQTVRKYITNDEITGKVSPLALLKFSFHQNCSCAALLAMWVPLSCGSANFGLNRQALRSIFSNLLMDLAIFFNA